MLVKLTPRKGFILTNERPSHANTLLSSQFYYPMFVQAFIIKSKDLLNVKNFWQNVFPILLFVPLLC